MKLEEIIFDFLCNYLKDNVYIFSIYQSIEFGYVGMQSNGLATFSKQKSSLEDIDLVLDKFFDFEIDSLKYFIVYSYLVTKSYRYEFYNSI